MAPNEPAAVTGCISNYTWCSVAIGGVTGWASAEYLVTDAGGRLTNLQVSGAELGIPIVVPEGVAEVVATPPVGVMVAVPPSIGLVQPILPAPEVLSYVTAQPIQPVLVDGEVMVGATLPAAVPVYPIPASPYVYSYVNGQRVLASTGRKENSLRGQVEMPRAAACIREVSCCPAGASASNVCFALVEPFVMHSC